MKKKKVKAVNSLDVLGQIWHKQFKNLALKDGWDLFMASKDDGDVLEIQAITDTDGVAEMLELKKLDNVFRNDAQAYEHVVNWAAKGSILHLHALYMDGRTAGNFVYLPKLLIGKKRGRWVRKG